MAISTAVDPSAVARVVGIDVNYQPGTGKKAPRLPQRLALFGQGATASTYATTKFLAYSSNQVGTTVGTGSPLHLASKQLLPANGDGIGIIPLTIYPLVDDGAAVIATGDITPVITTVTVTTAFRVKVNNILSSAFTVTSADTVATIVTKMDVAVAASPDLPIIGSDDTTALGTTSKWLGASANGIVLEIDGPTDAGVTFTFTQPVGGATNPDITAALAQMGEVWDSMVINCLDVADTTTLDLYQTEGEGRWGALQSRPFVVFTGDVNTTVASATTVPDARSTDRVNVQLVSPGSNDLPFVVAARQAARIVRQANANPPVDYGAQQATGLTPGVDGVQWSQTERQSAVLLGSSTIEVKDSVVNLSDTVTFYHPTGEDIPAYRYVVDIVKLQNLLYGIDTVASRIDWNGAPLVSDGQAITNKAAKKPKMYKAELAKLIDSWALDALISDPESAKTSIQTGISESNPKRMDAALTVKLSGNTNIISIDLNYGFEFGEAEIIA